jgi:hypothetical protein
MKESTAKPSSRPVRSSEVARALIRRTKQASRRLYPVLILHAVLLPLNCVAIRRTPCSSSSAVRFVSWNSASC